MSQIHDQAIASLAYNVSTIFNIDGSLTNHAKSVDIPSRWKKNAKIIADVEYQKHYQLALMSVAVRGWLTLDKATTASRAKDTQTSSEFWPPNYILINGETYSVSKDPHQCATPIFFIHFGTSELKNTYILLIPPAPGLDSDDTIYRIWKPNLFRVRDNGGFSPFYFHMTGTWLTLNQTKIFDFATYKYAYSPSEVAKLIKLDVAITKLAEIKSSLPPDVKPEELKELAKPTIAAAEEKAAASNPIAQMTEASAKAETDKCTKLGKFILAASKPGGLKSVVAKGIDGVKKQAEAKAKELKNKLEEAKDFAKGLSDRKNQIKLSKKAIQSGLKRVAELYPDAPIDPKKIADAYEKTMNDGIMKTVSENAKAGFDNAKKSVNSVVDNIKGRISSAKDLKFPKEQLKNLIKQGICSPNPIDAFKESANNALASAMSSVLPSSDFSQEDTLKMARMVTSTMSPTEQMMKESGLADITDKLKGIDPEFLKKLL